MFPVERLTNKYLFCLLSPYLMHFSFKNRIKIPRFYSESQIYLSEIVINEHHSTHDFTTSSVVELLFKMNQILLCCSYKLKWHRVKSSTVTMFDTMRVVDSYSKNVCCIKYPQCHNQVVLSRISIPFYPKTW